MYFGKSNKTKGERIPPDQNVTTGFPVLHHGNVPYYKDLMTWTLKIFGAVDHDKLLTYEDLMNLPQYEYKNDIHCVTGWSKIDNVWKGVSTQEIIRLVTIRSEAKYVILHSEEGWTTNLPIEDFFKETSILAHSHNGQLLTPEHGYPLRAVFPHLYFWKSAKWLRGIEFSLENQPGFWEKNGYHMYGDPWKSQRYSFD